jgi:hypothetical protein
MLLMIENHHLHSHESALGWQVGKLATSSIRISNRPLARQSTGVRRKTPVSSSLKSTPRPATELLGVEALRPVLPATLPQPTDMPLV